MFCLFLYITNQKIIYNKIDFNNFILAKYILKMDSETIIYIRELRDLYIKSNKKDFIDIFDEDDTLRVGITNEEFELNDLEYIHNNIPMFDGIMLVYDRKGLFYETLLKDLFTYEDNMREFILYTFKGELEIFDEHVWVGGDELIKEHKMSLHNILKFLYDNKLISKNFFDLYYEKIGIER